MRRVLRPGARSARLRFDGWIAGLGSASGTRVVLGHWPRSPFGPFSDVMLERGDGERLLLAPTRRTAEFVSGTYGFDAVHVVPVDVAVRADTWTVTAGPLRLRFITGRRTLLGHLLRAVPGPLAGRPAWSAVTDAAARVLVPGVRTRGTAGRGRREWYGARDLLAIRELSGTYDGADLGALAPVEPPVRFGFGSVPRRPGLTRVTTTVEVERSLPVAGASGATALRGPPGSHGAVREDLSGPS
ncbi:hypothetical protein ACWC2H_17790 [Streptomyces sp. 900105755]